MYGGWTSIQEQEGTQGALARPHLGQTQPILEFIPELSMKEILPTSSI